MIQQPATMTGPRPSEISTDPTPLHPPSPQVLTSGPLIGALAKLMVFGLTRRIHPEDVHGAHPRPPPPFRLGPSSGNGAPSLPPSAHLMPNPTGSPDFRGMTSVCDVRLAHVRTYSRGSFAVAAVAMKINHIMTFCKESARPREFFMQAQKKNPGWIHPILRNIYFQRRVKL